ncbi:MAG: putative cobaltochelatase, partial [Chloroflexota bacterium]|nr:putative cobaltochelatase [Chloroflexota bacterium]
ALLLNAINPKIGGVLIRGEKGTAKSMAVRGLARLLPEIEVVSGCAFFCDPERKDALCDRCAERIARGSDIEFATKQVSVVELPIGATEDRVVGTIDIEKAIKQGEKHFDPGLLAAANRGILYIDEVNLLDDHLVDILLDAAAMGVNFVEREGVSFSHPSEFILVGTMNPEEGDLRPQLLDRFGLAVEVKGISDQSDRKEIVRRRIGFENDPPTFMSSWQGEQEQMREVISQSKGLLPQVNLDEEMLGLITQICADFGVDGHRADIVMHKTATTLCAYHGRTEVTEDDVREAAELALPHRRRRQPFEEPQMDRQQLEESIQKWQQDNKTQPESDQSREQNSPFDDPPRQEEGEGQGSEQVSEVDQPYQVKYLAAAVLDRVSRSGSGRRSMSRTDSKTGRYVGSTIPQGKPSDLALDATFRAAAPFQVRRNEDSSSDNAMLIESHDLREKVREKKIGNLIMFVLDASGSMGAQDRMVATKGAILSLLLDAYQRRDRVGMVVFRGDSAEVVLSPTNSVEMAQKHLAQFPTGGRTPLAHGLKAGLGAVKEHLCRDKRAIPLLVVVSDGRTNVSLNGGNPVDEAMAMAREIKLAGVKSIVMDTERDFVKFGLAQQICDAMGGTYIKLEELKAERIASAVLGSLG